MYVQVGVNREGKKKKKRKKEKGSVQGFEICNVEGSLKGGKKKKKC